MVHSGSQSRDNLTFSTKTWRVGVSFDFVVFGRLVLALVVIISGSASVAWASSCPYCGRGYGAAAPGDEARVRALRAQHEATCSARPTGGGSSGPTWSRPVPRQPTAAELAWQRALAANKAGIDLSKQRRFREAEAQFRKALEDAPNEPTITNNLANALHGQGNDTYRDRNYAAAVSFYEAALALVPDDDEFKEALRYARNRLQEEEERRRQAAATRTQLDDARDRIGGMLGALAANNAQGGGALFDGMAGGSAGSGGGLGFGTPSQGEIASAGGATDATAAVGGLGFGSTGAMFVDSSVVDLRHLDPDGQITVDIGVVRGTGVTSVDNPSDLHALLAPQAAAGVRENRRTTVLLDALEVGRNDWDASFEYLDETMRRFPDDPVIRDTYQFLLGMASVEDVIDFPGREKRLDRDLFEVMEAGMAPFEGLDYESWSLVRRAQSAEEHEQARNLWRQASERNPDNRRLRDICNFLDGKLAIENSDFSDTPRD